MNYGLYLSAAGALSSMHRQAVLSNNLANMTTAAFKPDVVDMRQRLPERLENPNGFIEPRLMLERLGGGLFVEPTRVDLSQGNLEPSGNDLDVAFDGDGMFVVGDGRGTGPANERLTRDGRFSLNADGDLVTAAGGLPVLDANGGTISLTPGRPVAIDPFGQVTQDDRVAGQLKLVAAPPSRSLVKAGGNLFRLANNTRIPTQTPDGRLIQGHVEASGVDPITTIRSQ